MAKSIKETPVLYGKDAQKFSEKIAENASKKAPAEEIKRVMDNYHHFKDRLKDSY